MKEITDIIRSYEQALISGKRMALATVVHVEGSSYRRPGARMLVTDDGQLTGAISGGCLEGDALRKALLAISQQKNKLVTYDTTDENDTTLGVQLGCNGIVHILFEPIQTDNADNPVELLKKVSAKRQNAVLVTLFSLHSRTGAQPGTCFLHLQTDDQVTCNCTEAEMQEQLVSESQTAYQRCDSFFKAFDSQLTGFIEYFNTPPSLIIAGAGNDTIPLTEMASVLGWDVTVVDGRTGHATRQRFPKAGKVLVSRAEDVLKHITVDERTFVLLMTHNYNYDLALLKQLLTVDACQYVGALGPKKKLERMYAELESEGMLITDAQKAKVYGPVGLDIGAETSEEIALSVLAEIKAVLGRRVGLSLREKLEPIHNRSDQRVDYTREEKEDFLCAVQTIMP
ncbi:xanthine/CO dehydrogenase XdhC/CoxF family maturation factor [Dyadobacter sp. BE34]|uniref:Xanthine/CO dehydrogenase XdhC/CoxF family maturation factor n=1 Tax=Dyadobacter fermentans TaxID=94254 RepID=A0ABU1QSQ9_9BACT|nr:MULTISPECIES: XdhC family protein [Dyadobacter]MDR6804195.1 xanthine/CO dehydrogenase XdhC/CoxF family maturation factor [Dyadobacter fermentans]MDR7041935.1 xanthine/CO dehydrogenase XdhC/CoxF family maturation factor [Dyadobacter sp. BE242]MDR7196338.1 xanthine/CO dehydrogenase XdhC/CoxF family maturation factor [Dyadobacter sp. BE34]MDR7213117.1 xanthine/CO dehydrogenase XdhC/CoxF family maturation factor [Dyadobacter sp. BE31]MDR7261744.1 xanthine/CO dehydrogenase XdhC/CoxF family matur